MPCRASIAKKPIVTYHLKLMILNDTSLGNFDLKKLLLLVRNRGNLLISVSTLNFELQNSRCTKYQNVNYFSGVEVSRKCTISSEFRATRPKLYRNCVLTQNFHTKKLGELSAFCAVSSKSS